ncbi:MAG TPA: alanine--tRNA ligase-related protein, partial [Candidatus Paceibacterota bacterium]
DNFWGPTGDEGPCGPTTEIYVDGIEIWNIVFNEYYQKPDKTLEKLPIPGVDTGMGLERLAKVVQKVPTVFETDLFTGLVKVLPQDINPKKKRILADHTRAISFMISDGVRPSNKGSGYTLRRLLRRVLAQFDMQYIKLASDWVMNKYGSHYPELDRDSIWGVIEEERKQFIVALNLGMKELDKLEHLDSKTAFQLYSSYGLPLDVMKDKFPNLDIEKFEEEFSQHQQISQSGMEKKFKGGLAGHSEMEIRYHTTTHLLHQALRDVLGDGVEQKGSNITTERTRFDFMFPRKLTEEEKQKVEDNVNQKIKEALPVHNMVLPKEEAMKTGARHFFDQKYPDQVSIYFIGNDLQSAYSKEFCGGPHVTNTSELGHFKIQKEEAVAQGIRRIKAILE